VPFSCLLGGIFFKDRIGRWRSLGMLIAFAGLIVIAGSPSIMAQYIPFMLACAGAFAWALGNIWIKRFHDQNILGVLGWMGLCSIPQLLVLSLLTESGQWESLHTASLLAWSSLTYTVLCSTLIAYGLWYYLMSRFPVSQVVPYSLLVPCFGLGFAQLFLQEPLTPQFLLGGATTVCGVAMIVIRRPSAVRTEQAT
jgi:O-acetylserine/cysteine efflux transporter